MTPAMSSHPNGNPMSLLKKFLNRKRRRERRTKARIRNVAAAVASMNDETEYTLRLKDGRTQTLTGKQWKELEQHRQSLASS